jgi:hypothetical protein
LEIGKTRFSELYGGYQKDSQSFSLEYKRSTANRKLKPSQEKQIAETLRKEKEVIQDPNITSVTTYNFHAMKDDIFRETGEKISVGTIRDRAIQWKFYDPKKRKRETFREFEVGGFGILWQHDASIHPWSPFMEKFYLILTIDDHCRYIVGAQFFLEESSMNHIYVMEEAILCFGIPLGYYIDRHSIFTGHDRGGVSNSPSKPKEEFEVQFVSVCESLKIKPIYARSPQAKGKVERIFRYLQDRICRRSAKIRATTLEEMNGILQQEVEYYNHHRVHDTTKEIPSLRMNRSIEKGTCMARKWEKDKNYHDIFCLRFTRITNKLQQISYEGEKITIPNTVAEQKVIVKVRTDQIFAHLRICNTAGLILKEISLPLRKKTKEN